MTIDLKELREQVAVLVPIAEVAEAFGCTQMTIFNWRRYKGLPAVELPAFRRGAILFEPQSVLRWAKRHGIAVDEPKLLRRKLNQKTIR